MPADTPMMETADRIGKTMVAGEEKTYKRGRTKVEYTPWIPHTPNNMRVEADFLTDYVNSPKVRKALNVPDFVQAWEQCTDKIDYHIQVEASMWIYPVLKAAGVRMMHYSGDRDGAVPTYGTKGWVKSLKWPMTKEWRQWKTDGQVSGYIEKYHGLDFVTVKGVGHMAPQYARKPVKDMISAWIHGEDF